MKTRWLVVSLAALCLFVLVGFSTKADEQRMFLARLNGFQEVPAISSTGTAEIRLEIDRDNTEISYELSYSDLEGTATAAHIHLGQRGVAGGIIAFLCGGGGKPACPLSSGTVTGTIIATDIIGPAGQGIAPGEFAEALLALRAGKTYANVHSTKHPSGEIRGQIASDSVGNPD